MADDLKGLREAWEKRDARGVRSSSGKASLEDDNKVRDLADKYVKANKATYTGFENLSQELLVKMVDEARAVGDDDKVWEIQAWLFHRFEPQNIGGTYEGKLRVS
jgi:uncharacterized protein YggL (DUF469 family)